ncbi:c-type cytochrome [Thiomicrorhabdus hydrogeniphila]
MSVSISGCFESSSSEEMSDSGIYFPIDGVDYSAISLDASASGLNAGARLLASQCAQCHGTFGVAVASWPDLYGPGSVGTAMTDYQDLSYIDNLMHMHALAYTSAEVDLLKTYYSKINYNPVGG